MLEQEAAQLVELHLELGDAGGAEASGAEAGGAEASGAAGAAAAPADWRPFRLMLDIAPGWHLQANPPSESYLVPTTLAAEGADLRNLSYPAGEPLQVAFSSRPVTAYQGRVEIAGEIGRPADPPAEAAGSTGAARGPARLLLTYQLCDDRRCLPPVTRSVRIS